MALPHQHQEGLHGGIQMHKENEAAPTLEHDNDTDFDKAQNTGNKLTIIVNTATAGDCEYVNDGGCGETGPVVLVKM